LILSELASNALKHAFPDGRAGEIRICLAESNGKIALTVADTGIGFPPDLDFRSTQSLGLQLVGMLVEQLDGTIDLVRNGGTAFHVEFTEFRYAKRI
jgi:two-component sensor histidine kinase